MKYIFLLLPLLSGCSIDNFADANSMAYTREVTCFNGGKQVYHGMAKHKIDVGSSGYLEFQQADNDHYILARGDCFVDISLDK